MIQLKSLFLPGAIGRVELGGSGHDGAGQDFHGLDVWLERSLGRGFMSRLCRIPGRQSWCR
jgi:hypothetical protein